MSKLFPCQNVCFVCIYWICRILQIRGMPFLFETNEACIKQYVDNINKSDMEEKKRWGLNDWLQGFRRCYFLTALSVLLVIGIILLSISSATILFFFLLNSIFFVKKSSFMQSFYLQISSLHYIENPYLKYSEKTDCEHGLSYNVFQ